MTAPFKDVNIYKIKELLGHPDIRDTIKYSHMSMACMKEDIKNLESLGFWSIIHKKRYL